MKRWAVGSIALAVLVVAVLLNIVEPCVPEVPEARDSTPVSAPPHTGDRAKLPAENLVGANVGTPEASASTSGVTDIVSDWVVSVFAPDGSEIRDFTVRDATSEGLHLLIQDADRNGNSVTVGARDGGKLVVEAPGWPAVDAICPGPSSGAVIRKSSVTLGAGVAEFGSLVDTAGVAVSSERLRIQGVRPDGRLGVVDVVTSTSGLFPLLFADQTKSSPAWTGGSIAEPGDLQPSVWRFEDRCRTVSSEPFVVEAKPRRSATIFFPPLASGSWPTAIEYAVFPQGLLRDGIGPLYRISELLWGRAEICGDGCARVTLPATGDDFDIALFCDSEATDAQHITAGAQISASWNILADIEGTVVDDSRRPVEGAWVGCMPPVSSVVEPCWHVYRKKIRTGDPEPHPDVPWVVTTSPRGEFRIPYRAGLLLVQHPDLAPVVALPTVALAPLTLEPACTVQGHVSGFDSYSPSGKGDAQLFVVAWCWSRERLTPSEIPSRWIRMTSDGDFRIPGLPPGEVGAHLETADGAVLQDWGAIMVPGQTETVNFTARPTSHLTVLVRNAPATIRQMRLVMVDTQEEAQLHACGDDDTSCWSVNIAWRGQAEVLAWCPGFSAWQSGGIIEVTDTDSTHAVSFRQASLALEVTGYEELYPLHVDVDSEKHDQLFPGQDILWPETSCTLRVTDPGPYELHIRSGALHLLEVASAQAIAVSVGSPAPARVVIERARFEVRILDGRGLTVAGVPIQASSGAYVAIVTSDDSGRVSFDMPSTGPVLITTANVGSDTEWTSDTLELPSGTTANVDLLVRRLEKP